MILTFTILTVSVLLSLLATACDVATFFVFVRCLKRVSAGRSVWVEAFDKAGAGLVDRLFRLFEFKPFRSGSRRLRPWTRTLILLVALSGVRLLCQYTLALS